MGLVVRVGVAVAICLALPVSAEAKGIVYDCDTASDHFSELALPAGPTPFRVSGNVQVNQLAPVLKYAPLAKVWISNAAVPGASPTAFAGFSLTALATNSKKAPSGQAALQMLSFETSGGKEETLPGSLLTQAGTVEPFSLTYDGKSVRVELGSESRTFPLTAEASAVRVICSTGEFLFTDLEVTPAG